MATVDMLLHGFTLATDQGSAGFCGVTLIRGAKNTLVDVAHIGRRELLVNKLKERGLRPEDIDQVFLTHAHWDHSLNVDVFPNAEILLSPEERDYCKAPKDSDWATPRWVTLMLESQKVREVREGEEIDDGVTVLSTPGHSKGSQALLLRSGSDTISVCGDALPNGYSVITGEPRLIFWDKNEALGSIRKLLDRATVFYPGHDRPFRVGDARKVTYLEPTSVRVFGWPDPGEGEGPGGVTYSLDPYRTVRVVD